MAVTQKSKPNLTDEERQSILHSLLRCAQGCKLQRGVIEDLAKKYGKSTKTIHRIWIQAKNCMNQETPINVMSRKKQNCGRKKHDRQIQLNAVTTVPWNQRSTLRSLSHAIKIPRSSLHDLMKRDAKIKRISSAIKPLLTEKNKIERLKFCLSMVDSATGFFDTMYNQVHVDEKWFYMTKNSRNYYVLDGEIAPNRTTKSKRFVTKVMFLAAVSRPRFDPSKNTLFDGKLGIWPFVTHEPAKRNSKNRSKGTLITKPMNVDGKVYADFLKQHVLPSIKQKWPRRSKYMAIKIQQDNAKPHGQFVTNIINEVGSEDGWNIKLVNQPPNSPDFNVLDLGFFNAIQSLQHQQSPKTIDDLVYAVQNAYNDIDPNKLNDTFLSLQKAMESTMAVAGDNNYSLGHIGKQKLRRQGRLPEHLVCNSASINIAKNIIESSS